MDRDLSWKKVNTVHLKFFTEYEMYHEITPETLPKLCMIRKTKNTFDSSLVEIKKSTIVGAGHDHLTYTLRYRISFS